jgi:hypothetical protein
VGSGFIVGSPSFAADGGGGGGWLFRPSVVWLVAADLLSSPILHELTVDVCSSSLMRLGESSGRWILWHQQCLESLVKFGDGFGFASSSVWRSAALATSLEVVVCKFQIYQGAICKKLGMYCVSF